MPGPSAELVQQLYRTPPDRFVAARDAAVADGPPAGDPSAARQLARLRRPTVAAWLVNLLAIRRPELVADLVELADALRTAQRELRGPRLRELSAQRRAVVGALVAEVRKLAAAEPDAPPAGRLPLAEVEATLNAALSDAEVAEQVRAGRLLRAASYAGFGEVPRPQLRLVTGDDEEPEAERPRPPARRPARASREATRPHGPGRRSAPSRPSGLRSGRPAPSGPGSAAPWTGAGQGPGRPGAGRGRADRGDRAGAGRRRRTRRDRGRAGRAGAAAGGRRAGSQPGQAGPAGRRAGGHRGPAARGRGRGGRRGAGGRRGGCGRGRWRGRLTIDGRRRVCGPSTASDPDRGTVVDGSGRPRAALG